MGTSKSPEKVLIEITEETSKLRIDKVIGEHPQIGSRSRAQQLIESKMVFYKDKPVKASAKTECGEVYLVHLPEAQATNLEPFDLKLDIYFEDKNIIVLNKPAGLVVHPSHGHSNKTLVNALIFHTSDLSMGFNEERPGIVHRLDKDTSGLLVVAKNDESHKSLAEQFKNRSVDRLYEAICYSSPKFEAGRIESHIIRHPTQRKKFCSEKYIDEPKGKWSATNWKLLKKRTNYFSIVECKLETGRTHQIRVHLSEIGLPIFGDQLYGNSTRYKSLPNKNLQALVYGMNRIGLHAKTLGFVHPKTNESLNFEAPWPEDMLKIIDSLNFE